jgi:phosphomannomutase
MLNFISKDFDYGIMITASHDPKEYNGIKVCKKSIPLGYDDLAGVEKRIKSFPIIDSKVDIVKKDFVDEYVKEFIPFEGEGLLIDCSHGSTGVVVGRLFPKATVLNAVPDGSFPSHGPNPSEKASQEYFMKEFVKGGFDFGFMLDGDGDRVLFFNSGGVISPSKIACVFIEKFKFNVVKDITCSRIIDDVAFVNGVKVFVSKVGRVNIPSRMRKVKADFGVENSAHFYFKDFNYLDSGVYTALKLLSLEGVNFSKYDKYFEDLINIESSDQDVTVKKLIAKLPKPLKTESVDGMSFYFKDFWLNIRKSNTEPVVRVKIEAISKKVLEKIVGLLY